jgi:hypothetical protein
VSDRRRIDNAWHYHSPVAAEPETLVGRVRGTAAAETTLRAKTGTQSGVAKLTGHYEGQPVFSITVTCTLLVSSWALRPMRQVLITSVKAYIQIAHGHPHYVSAQALLHVVPVVSIKQSVSKVVVKTSATVVAGRLVSTAISKAGLGPDW